LVPGIEPYLIRRARSTDVRELADVLRAAYAPFVAEIADLPDVAAGLENDISSHEVWIATHDDKILGGLVLGTHGDVAHLINLAVHPDAGGAGLGRALIDQGLAQARASGATVINLATHVKMPKNVALYRHLGWKETAREGNKVFMSRSLSPDPSAPKTPK